MNCNMLCIQECLLLIILDLIYGLGACWCRRGSATFDFRFIIILSFSRRDFSISLMFQNILLDIPKTLFRILGNLLAVLV